MAFLTTLVIALFIHARIMRIRCCPVQIFAIDFKRLAIHNTTKYSPYLRWSHVEKTNCLVQMNTCALRLIIVEHDPVDFIFTWPLLL